MGFSLKKLVKHAVADVNPFDGPQPGSTAHPSGISAVVKNVGQAVNRDVIHPVTHNAITNGVGAVAKELPQATVKTFSPLARSAVGTAQGVSGLVDLATPGNGTSRVSKGLNWEAQQLDKAPQLSKVYYHGGQAVGDIGQFALGGGAVKAAAEIPKIGKAAEIAGVASNAVERGANTLTKGLREGNIAQRVAGNTVKNVLNPKYQAGNAAFTGLQAGKDAAQGKQVTPAGVTTNLVIGGVGFPAAGAVAHETVAPVVQAGVNQLRKADLIAPSSLNPTEVAHLSNFAQQARSGAINEPSVYDNGVAAAKKAGVDYRDPTAVDALLGAHRNYDTQVQQRMMALQAMQQQVANTNRSLRTQEDGFIAGPRSIGFAGAKKNGRVFEGVDGKPRFEVSDESAKLKVSPDDEYKFNTMLRNNEKGQPKAANLGDILDHPQLYAQYPELRHLSVKAVDMPADSKAMFNPADASISISKHLSPDSFKSTLLHEVQHAIQKNEGFAHGGSPEALAQEKLAQVNKRLQEIETAPKPRDAKLAGEYRQLKKEQGNLRYQPGTQYSDYHNLAGEAEARAVQARMNMKGGERYVKDVPETPDYAMSHRPNEGPRAFDLTEKVDGEQMIPSDMYTQWYGSRGSTADKESIAALKAVKGNPDANVTIYRASPKGDFNHGDWVTLSKDYAKQHAEGQGGKIHSKVVKAKDLKWAMDDVNEFGYYPEGKLKSTFYDSLDVPKDQLIVKTGGDGVVNGKAMSIETKKPTPFQKNLQDTGLAPNPKAITKQAPPITQNSLTAKAAKQNISPETAKLVSGEGFVRNTKQLQDTAVQKADKQGLNKTIQSAHEALAVPAGKIDDTTVAHVQQAIERADAAGRTQDAVGLHDALSEHLRKQGQTIQAASLLYKLSPQGLFYKGMRDIKRSGTEMTPELTNKLKSLSEQIKAAPDETTKTEARAAFHKLVADNLKQKNSQKILSVWKAGLLSGPLTQAGNFASNATFGTLHKASDPLAAGLDKIISFGTGNRTKTLSTRGILKGAKEGAGTGINTMKTGIDVRNIEGNKYELHGELNFKNPVIQNVFGKTSNLVFRGMSAADQPFYYSALKNNLADIAKADGINRGLKGRKLAEHVGKMMNSPTKDMAETAKLAAQKSVLGQDSKIASSVSKFAQEHPAVQAVVPFVKVPTNFLTRTLDFTPVGAVKTAVQQIRSGKLDQRALSEALSEATTGTAIIGLGAELANSNMLSGQYPSGDPKEVQRWKAEGIQPNSVKIGGKWINLNYLGPLGLLLGAGKDYHTAAVQGDNGAMQSIAGLGKGIAGQSFLTGFSGAANAINDPGRYGANFVHSQASSVIPAWANALGNATDPNQRQADSTLTSVQSRIPGARNYLPVKTDVYGNALKQRTNPLDMTVDPLKPSNDLSQKNGVVSEVNRLHRVDPNNNDLQVTPTPPTSIKVGDQSIKLNGKQKYELQNKVGQAIQHNWSNLIQTPEYKALSDVDKAKALSNLRSDTTSLMERSYVTDNNLGNYTKQASAKVSALGDGSANLASYADTSSSGGGGSTNSKALYASPDAEYKSLLTKSKTATYNSPAEKIKADKTLAKAKVGSTFDKKIRDLYNAQLSNADVYEYLHNDPDGNNLAKQLLAYGDALTNAGLVTKNKFKNKKGVVTLGSSSKSAKASKARKASNTKFAAALKATNSATSSSDKALQNLIKNAKVTSRSGSSKNLKVAQVTLKKQSTKKEKVKAIA